VKSARRRSASYDHSEASLTPVSCILPPFTIRSFSASRTISEGPVTPPSQTGTYEANGFPSHLPPLPEQRAIAHVLRTVQRAKEATEKVIAACRQLKESLMQHLFTYGPVPFHQADQVELKETEAGTIPADWHVARIGDMATQTQYGLSKRGEKSGKYPILRMNNLDNGRVTTRDLQFVDVGNDEFEKFRVNAGDILFNRTNSYELVGKTALFDLPGDYIFASYLIRVTVDMSRAIPGYLNYYLNTESTQARLKQLATRAVSQSNINATKLRGFTVPLALLSTQKEIASILSKVDRKLDVEKARRQALDALFQTLLHNLMTGKVRVDDLDLAESGEGA